MKKSLKVPKTHNYPITSAAVAPVDVACPSVRPVHEAEAGIHYLHHPQIMALPLLTEDLADFKTQMGDLDQPQAPSCTLEFED